MNTYVKRISLVLGLATVAFAQTTTAPIYTASIVAGIPTASGNGYGDGGPSVFGVVSSPQGIAVDANGNIFVSDNTNSRIRRIDGTTGIISTFTTSNISNPNGMAFDSKGDLIIAENGNNGQIIRVTPDGKTSQVIAGTNVSGTFGGDGQYAFNSVLNSPAGVALDKNDNIYIADTSNNRVRMIKNVNNCVYTPLTISGTAMSNSCTVSTIAGGLSTPQFGVLCGTNNTCLPDGTNTVGDGGPAVLARVQGPYGIAVTPDGSKVYVAQNGDHRIRAIDMNTGLISSLIGNCLAGALVIPCTSGNFGSPTNGNSFGDGKPAVQGTTNNPRGLYLDSTNNILYFTDGGSTAPPSGSNGRSSIRAINLSTGIVNTVVGGGGTAGDSSSGLQSGLLTNLSLNSPYGVWVQNGLIYWVEQGNNRVRVGDPVGQTVKTLVNTIRSSGSGGSALQAYLGFATSLATTGSPRVAVDGAGNVYVVESSVHKVRKVTPDGNINDWAGTGVAGSTGDGAAAVGARLSSPQSVAFDSAGNGYIADTGNNKIRKVDTNGIITTVVGRAQITTCSATTAKAGQCFVDKSNYVGDGGDPLQAVLNGPQGIAVDGSGNLIIADSGHNSIRFVNVSANTINTIGGGQPATLAGQPIIDGPTDGRSGLGTSGQADSISAVYGLLNNPRGVAVDSHGNIYIADYGNSVARELVPTNLGAYSYGMFSFYGSGSSSGTTPNIPTGTGAPSIPARIRISNNNATSVAVDSGNNIYYALAADNRVHVILADHSAVYVVGGGGSVDTGSNYTSSNGLNIGLPAVTGVAVDSAGNVYTADRSGLVRKFACTMNCPSLTAH